MKHPSLMYRGKDAWRKVMPPALEAMATSRLATRWRLEPQDVVETFEAFWKVRTNRQADAFTRNYLFGVEIPDLIGFRRMVRALWGDDATVPRAESDELRRWLRERIQLDGSPEQDRSGRETFVYTGFEDFLCSQLNARLNTIVVVPVNSTTSDAARALIKDAKQRGVRLVGPSAVSRVGHVAEPSHRATDKKRAQQAYKRTGTIRKTSELTGIARSTLSRWGIGKKKLSH